jgi:hypothetical protein
MPVGKVKLTKEQELIQLTAEVWKQTISPKIVLYYEDTPTGKQFSWRIGEFGTTIGLPEEVNLGEVLVEVEAQIKSSLIKKGLEFLDKEQLRGVL